VSAIITAQTAGAFKPSDALLGQLKAHKTILEQQRDKLKRLVDLLESGMIPEVM
jgi:hypothetical protein